MNTETAIRLVGPTLPYPCSPGYPPTSPVVDALRIRTSLIHPPALGC